MICYRCQEMIPKRGGALHIKNGLVTTTYCKHCYGAVTRGVSRVKTI